MNALIETRYELNQLLSEERAKFGLHMGEQITVGAPGIAVGDVPFDPALHSVEDIDPLSDMEMLTGMPHVTQVMPFRPVEMQLVVHNSQPSVHTRTPDYLRPLYPQKARLAARLKDALDDVAQYGDSVETFVVGADLPREQRPFEHYERIEAADVLDICRRGLTFVFSDFENLPLGRNGKTPGLGRTVAVKANHKMELHIPPKIGPVAFDGEEVDTYSRRQLARANEVLARKHAAVEQRLVDAGLAVARVVLDHKLDHGFDMGLTDRSLARAVRRVANS